ncbi:Rhamnogalacturonase A [Venturia inaequalis]|nr:Rhamnogalacturonase A [Venturia inaequalis]
MAFCFPFFARAPGSWLLIQNQYSGQIQPYRCMDHRFLTMSCCTPHSVFYPGNVGYECDLQRPTCGGT